MALVIKDRVKETSTSTGTGSFVLAGAATGFQSFTSALADGDTTHYAIEDGTDWETGLGTWTESTSTLARTTIYESSNSGNAVDWGAGTKNVFITVPASRTANSPVKEFTTAKNVTAGDLVVVNTNGTVEAAASVDQFVSDGTIFYDGNTAPESNNYVCYVPWLDKWCLVGEFSGQIGVYSYDNDSGTSGGANNASRTLVAQTSTSTNNIHYAIAIAETKQLFVFHNGNNLDVLNFNASGAYTSVTNCGNSVFSSGYAIHPAQSSSYASAPTWEYNPATGYTIFGFAYHNSSNIPGYCIIASDGTGSSNTVSLGSQISPYAAWSRPCYIHKVPGNFSNPIFYHAQSRNTASMSTYLQRFAWDGQNSLTTSTGSVFPFSGSSNAGYFSTWEEDSPGSEDGTFWVGYRQNFYTYFKGYPISSGAIGTPTSQYRLDTNTTSGTADLAGVMEDLSTTGDGTPSSITSAPSAVSQRSDGTVGLLFYGTSVNTYSYISIDCASDVISGGFVKDRPRYEATSASSGAPGYATNGSNVITAAGYDSRFATRGGIAWAQGDLVEVIDGAAITAVLTGETKPIIGTADSTVTSGNPVKVNLLGNLVDSFTGLSVGKKLYATGAGVITETATNNRAIGASISSTEIVTPLATLDPIPAASGINTESDVTSIIDSAYITGIVGSSSEEKWVELIAPTTNPETSQYLTIDGSTTWQDTYQRIRFYLTGVDLWSYPGSSSAVTQTLSDFRIILRRNSTNLTALAYRTEGTTHRYNGQNTISYGFTGYAEPFHPSYAPKVYAGGYPWDQLGNTSDQPTTLTFDLVFSPTASNEAPSVHCEYDGVYLGYSNQYYHTRSFGTILFYSTNTATNNTRYFGTGNSIGLYLDTGNANILWGGQYTVLGLERFDTLGA